MPSILEVGTFSTTTKLGFFLSVCGKQTFNKSKLLKCKKFTNAKKTELMTFNYKDEITIITLKGDKVKNVLEFKYLGGWMASSEHDFEIREAMAWSACNKLKLIWSSNLTRNLKIRLFRATVESVLLYNSETWTINKTLQRKIDGCYTRMLRMAVGLSLIHI